MCSSVQPQEYNTKWTPRSHRAARVSTEKPNLPARQSHWSVSRLGTELDIHEASSHAYAMQRTLDIFVLQQWWKVHRKK